MHIIEECVMRSGAKLRVAMRSGAEIWTGAADPGWQSIREVVGFYNHLVITSAAQLHVQVPPTCRSLGGS